MNTALKRLFLGGTGEFIDFIIRVFSLGRGGLCQVVILRFCCGCDFFLSTLLVGFTFLLSLFRLLISCFYLRVCCFYLRVCCFHPAFVTFTFGFLAPAFGFGFGFCFLAVFLFCFLPLSSLFSRFPFRLSFSPLLLCLILCSFPLSYDYGSSLLLNVANPLFRRHDRSRRYRPRRIPSREQVIAASGLDGESVRGFPGGGGGVG